MSDFRCQRPGGCSCGTVNYLLYCNLDLDETMQDDIDAEPAQADYKGKALEDRLVRWADSWISGLVGLELERQ